jgi:hypothetical protein
MTLQETFADVAALIPRYSWEIMDEEQRDDLMKNVVLPRYMETTADGVQLGPTAWAEMVGASPAAIKSRIQRLQTSRKQRAEEGARAVSESRVRHARSALREADSDTLAEIMDTLPAERRAAVVRAAIPPPDRTAAVKSGPTFIDLLVRANSALIELEAMVAGWQNPAAVPVEFSRESFNDVVAKALRIQDKFDRLVDAMDDEDEFLAIVRNFGETSDVG